MDTARDRQCGHAIQVDIQPDEPRPRSRAKGGAHPKAQEERPGSKAEARATEKKKIAARRQELLVGLGEDDKREMTSFMGLVNAQTRKTLQEVVRTISKSGQDPRMLKKKALIHALARLDIDRSILFLETMLSLGQDAMLQLLWLYERYNVANAGGGMTKCAKDHFGQDMGVNKVDELFDMSQEGKKVLLLQLADWNPVRKVKVMKAWEASDPAMTADFLLELIQEEQARGEGPDGLWQCSLCPVKRNVEVEARMKRGEHRRKDRTIDAGSLYDYRVKGSGGGSDTYSFAHESLFEFKQQRHQHLQQDESPWETGGTAGGAGAANGTKPQGGAQKTRYLEERARTASGAGDLASSPAKECLDRSGQREQQLQFVVTYAGVGFDPRRVCAGCTEELRAATISSGHDLELWHTVDHERRALLTGQRRADVLKARWAERERKDRQVSELLRLISEANLDACSRHSLEDRAKAAQNLQAAEVRRMLDLKLSYAAAVKSGACKDEGLKTLNEREATAWAAKLRLKAALNMDRHYASLEPGGLPASLRRRNPTSSQPSDFLDDGTPATPQGAMQTFGRACPPEDNESGAIRLWKRGAKETEEVLDLRRDVREWQSSCGRRGRFSYLCERWVGVASDIEEKQRQKRMIEAAEREKRMKERQAAKLLRKRQLAELRANAGSRATGEERRKVERDKEAEERKRLEGEELEGMSREEAAQLAGGDRYWGLIRELQRLRVIEEERRRAWEVRIRATKEKMVAVRCISELSDFTHATPPIDPELQQQIDRLLEI
ncbi:unnamed protein product [Ectocarpus sp. 4 AP-2014]